MIISWLYLWKLWNFVSLVNISKLESLRLKHWLLEYFNCFKEQHPLLFLTWVCHMILYLGDLKELESFKTVYHIFRYNLGPCFLVSPGDSVGSACKVFWQVMWKPSQGVSWGLGVSQGGVSLEIRHRPTTPVHLLKRGNHPLCTLAQIQKQCHSRV